MYLLVLASPFREKSTRCILHNALIFYSLILCSFCNAKVFPENLFPLEPNMSTLAQALHKDLQFYKHYTSQCNLCNLDITLFSSSVRLFYFFLESHRWNEPQLDDIYFLVQSIKQAFQAKVPRTMMIFRLMNETSSLWIDATRRKMSLLFIFTL